MESGGRGTGDGAGEREAEEGAMSNVQVIISPAKKMRRAGAGTPADDVAPRGIPPFPEVSRRLAERLRSMGRDELQALWKTSDRLTGECLEATRRLEVPRNLAEARGARMAATLTPAILTYDGIQFRSMAPEVLEGPALEWLQAHLWVLSGLHGCVRPLDAVMPYRLEMGARLQMDAPADLGPSEEGASRGPTRDLYQFWGDAIERHVAAGADVVVNLASVEYARSVVPCLGDVPCVTCVFGEDLRAGRPVQRSTASKAARGSMVRWMAERALDDPDDLRHFDVGYHFDEGLSEPGHLVFMRA